MIFQQTVATAVEISGQALFRGTMVKMRILPQPANTGIYFKRSDLPGEAPIKAEPAAVVDARKSVTLGRNGWKIATIEHLMAVFHGLGIDNALVEVDGEELPLGDGSGRYYAERILAAGLVAQDSPRRYTVVKEPFWVEGSVSKQNQPSKAALIILPSDNERFEVSFTFTSDHKATGTQYYHFSLSPESFMEEIVSARTIAFLSEIEFLRSQGLALADDMNVAVVVGENGYENELRFEDEIVRHKILDMLGDLYLVGPLIGRVVAVRSGHALDLELAKKIRSHY